jgi:hypothetical protein
MEGRLQAVENELQALKDRQKPEAYYPKLTLTDLRQRVETVTGPRPVWTEDPGDAA